MSQRHWATPPRSVVDLCREAFSNSVLEKKLIFCLVLALHFFNVILYTGKFYACEVADESVLGMCTSPDDSVLVTGDTVGRVTVWSIADYCNIYLEQVLCCFTFSS